LKSSHNNERDTAHTGIGNSYGGVVSLFSFFLFFSPLLYPFAKRIHTKKFLHIHKEIFLSFISSKTRTRKKYMYLSFVVFGDGEGNIIYITLGPSFKIAQSFLSRNITNTSEALQTKADYSMLEKLIVWSHVAEIQVEHFKYNES
jgi:hypothetical protein